MQSYGKPCGRIRRGTRAAYEFTRVFALGSQRGLVSSVSKDDAMCSAEVANCRPIWPTEGQCWMKGKGHFPPN